MDIKQLITEIAFDLGFDAVGITLANEIKSSKSHFLEWRAKGFAADMDYLLRENPINANPKKLLPEAKSIITLLVNYYTEPPNDPGPDYGRVATYAVGKDYHKVLRKKIKLFQGKIKKYSGETFISRGFSDSVPLLEKSFARNSGLGFFGRNTLLINKPFGSYFFICELISNLEIEPTEEKNGTCGKCTRCIDICPTGALGVGDGPAKGEARQRRRDYPLLDSRLCISYLTIENKKDVLFELRDKIGNWVFGCDLCQEVCPYNNIKNKKRKETTWEEFKPGSGVGHWISLKEILSIRTEQEFHKRFCHTSLVRPKRRGLLRNAAIVAGNRLSEAALPEIIWLSKNEQDQIIKEHAMWALSKYSNAMTFNINFLTTLYEQAH